MQDSFTYVYLLPHQLLHPASQRWLLQRKGQAGLQDLLCCAERSADEVIHELNQRHQSYRLVEQDLSQRRVRLMGKLPEIEKAVAAVALLLERREAGKDVRRVRLPLHSSYITRQGTRMPCWLE